VSNDPLSDILRLTEANSIVSGGVAAGGTWSLRVPLRGEVAFGAVVKGSCWLRVHGQPPIRLEQGDVGLLSGREGAVLCSHLNATPVDPPRLDRWSEIIKLGDGSGCTWLVGRVAVAPSSAFLLTEALPNVIHVRSALPAAASLRWIIEELFHEQTTTLVGSSIASAQLAQLFFVKVLRAHLASEGELPAGWLRAIRDERIVRALRLIHAEPGRDLGLEALARAAGMSRTRFAVRFKSVAGMPALAYLTQWRMRLAQRVLRDEETSMLELATSLGYASESAFSNAFKRVTGTAPRAYRVAERARKSSVL